MTHVTKRDLPAKLWGVECVIPKGTAVDWHEFPTGGAYAIRSVSLLVQLTGNTHDPHYRYAWINDPAEIEEA